MAVEGNIRGHLWDETLNDRHPGRLIFCLSVALCSHPPPAVTPPRLCFRQHPRVRHAACTCLGQMSDDFGPTFQRKFHAQVVPGLLCALEDSSTPRVQAQAGTSPESGARVPTPDSGAQEFCLSWHLCPPAAFFAVILVVSRSCSFHNFRSTSLV